MIHCTAGKDRTGIFFGLLFAFLGVPASTIAEEYNLTEVGLQHIREDLVNRLMHSPGFKKYTLSQMAGKEMSTGELAKLIEEKGTHLGGADEKIDGEEIAIPPEVLEKGRQAAIRMVGAREESMKEALKMVEAEWGSAEGYMRAVCGLGDDDLEALKRVLVVEG